MENSKSFGALNKCDRGQLWFVRLPKGMRDAIDNNPVRLHKDRVLLILGKRGQKKRLRNDVYCPRYGTRSVQG